MIHLAQPKVIRSCGAALGAAALVTLLPGCAQWPVVPISVPAYRAAADSLRYVPARVTLSGRRQGLAIALPVLPIPPPSRPDSLKVHRRLRQVIHTRPNDSDTVLVTFRDPYHGDTALVRTFAPPSGFKVDAQTYDSLAKAGRALLADSLRHGRAPLYDQQAESLRVQYGAIVLPQRFIFGQALVAVMPLRMVFTLAHNPEVLRIDPLYGDPPPTACGNGGTHVDLARGLLQTEHFVDAKKGDGRIALLDTGVQQEHVLLRSGEIASQQVGGGMTAVESSIEGVFDCNSGTCVKEVPPQMDEYSEGHGTRTAGILAANEMKLITHRGLTKAKIDSYKIYSGSGSKVNEPAAMAAFESAIVEGYHVIVAEIADGDGFGSMTERANWAFLSGAMVVAANGNWANEPIPQPANSPLAIGVGPYCVSTQKFDPSSSYGTTPDGRIKPDVCGLTDIYTATNHTSRAGMNNFPGTSGATPTVAAGALLMRNWMAGTSIIDPGQVYAMLLMCGQLGKVSSNEGTGLIQLPNDGVAWWDVMDVPQGPTQWFDVDVGSQSIRSLEAAIWWPEYGAGNGGFPADGERAHITLEVVDPSGGSRKSEVLKSAFQRVSLSAPSGAQSTVWSIGIKGKVVPGNPRAVYWAVWAKP